LRFSSIILFLIEKKRTGQAFLPGAPSFVEFDHPKAVCGVFLHVDAEG